MPSPVITALQDARAWTPSPTARLPAWARLWRWIRRSPTAALTLDHPSGLRIDVYVGAHSWFVKDALAYDGDGAILAQVPSLRLNLEMHVRGKSIDPDRMLTCFHQDLQLSYGPYARARLDHVLDQVRFLCLKRGIQDPVLLSIHASKNLMHLDPWTPFLCTQDRNLVSIPLPLREDLLVRRTVLYPSLSGTLLTTSLDIQIDPPASAHARLSLHHWGEAEGWVH